MVLPHNIRCPIDMMKPRPTGVCDRCDFLFFLDDLSWQFQWSGTALVNQRILVCQTCLDKPAEFLKTVILGPEPAPLPNARPTAYATQNQGGEPPLTTVSEILGDDP